MLEEKIEDLSEENQSLFMPLFHQTFLLFALNLLDALLTLIWVRNGVVTEGNQLMATLLDIGDLPFLGVKLAVGSVTAFVLWRWRSKKLARYGLLVALSVYIGLMGIHFLTGLFALGYVTQAPLHQFATWSGGLLA